MNLKALNTVKQTLSEAISFQELQLKIYKQLAKVAYKEAEPDTERGREAFHKLNMYRDRLRKINKELDNLRYSQHQVKHSIKSVYENRRLLKRIDISKVSV